MRHSSVPYEALMSMSSDFVDLLIRFLKSTEGPLMAVNVSRIILGFSHMQYMGEI